MGKYGVGNYEKCANCMVHAASKAARWRIAIQRPLKDFADPMRGVKTDGALAKDIDLSKQRPAEFTFPRHVENKMSGIKRTGQIDRAGEIAAAE